MRQSIRFKLILLFLTTIVFPAVVIVIAIPSYYQNLLTSQESTQIEDTLTTFTYSIETYLDDLDRMTITPYLNDDVMMSLKLKSSNRKFLTPFEQYEAEQALSNTLPKFLKNTRKDILGTILLPMDNSIYITSPNGYVNKVVEGYPFEKQDWYIQALKADGKVAFISIHVQNYLEGAGAEVFSVARLIKDPDSQHPLGVIMADADTAALETMMRGIRLKNGSIAVILDDKRKLIYASQPLTANLQSQLTTNTSFVTDANESYSVVIETVSRSNWKIAVLFPESVIRKQLQTIYWIGFLFAACGLIIALLLYFTISHWMLTPFKQMIKVMKKVQRGNLDTFYSVRGNDEVAQLGKSLNTMISQLGELIDREFRAALGQRNAEYRALQSQIQPHFLYNTLNGFIGLNRTGQSVLLERAILSLSGMMRYTLNHNDWVLLKEEMDFVTKYCELQQIRFADKLEVRIDYGPDTVHIPVPKLLLQPFVENAILHGVEPSEQVCQLTIEAANVTLQDVSGEWLEIRIADNGVGYDPETEQEGVGITNVRERLRVAHEGSKIIIAAAKGQGTLVIIQFPLKDVNRK
ncbi:two-component system, sensor histidine kinase YesM [Paenibacillus sp. 1_12]|uniref:cache domain-containing sensor histidine kinase n=1 Tax=Paenibacillus sp. 1_12 TaxID=1566278 RepID=UPI0008ED8071|nr:sensor histidine kinase [Paenibacillus sp. 1_12]SFM27074.1 two-component system, sensor histidine kinase YesM [Paenibacillus sp. 1_12]